MLHDDRTEAVKNDKINRKYLKENSLNLPDSKLSALYLKGEELIFSAL